MWCRCRPRVRTLLEHYYALEKTFPVKITGEHQDIVRAVANRAGLTQGRESAYACGTLSPQRLYRRGSACRRYRRSWATTGSHTTAIYLNFTNVHIQDEFERKW